MLLGGMRKIWKEGLVAVTNLGAAVLHTLGAAVLRILGVAVPGIEKQRIFMNNDIIHEDLRQSTSSSLAA